MVLFPSYVTKEVTTWGFPIVVSSSSATDEFPVNRLHEVNLGIGARSKIFFDAVLSEAFD